MINKVLLVDDDMPTNFYHKLILKESNLVKEIIDCISVDEAIAELRSGKAPPDIILLDINMPLKTGWDFLQEYEELGTELRAKKVIILSTTRIPSDLERANDNPLVSDFLLKPLTKEMIEQIESDLW